MAFLKRSDIRIFDDALDMHGGYVLNFSDRTMQEFFEDEFGIDIYSERYRFNGSSKAKHVRAFLTTEEAPIVAPVLRRLWQYRESLPNYADTPGAAQIKERFFELVTRIEAGADAPRTDVIERFVKDETLDELVASIGRDIAVNRPQAALDRLHTYCMKKFGHLLDTRSVAWTREEPLHSRVGKYTKALEQDQPLQDVSRQIIKSAIGVFDKFNHVRNNQSLAHDNTLLSLAEARFIYDSVTALLRFVKAVEHDRFGA